MAINTSMEKYNEIKRLAKERFALYTRDYDTSQPKIYLKVVHTYRVADFCEQIALSEGLEGDDLLVAWMSGLLHDIGRFEQVTRYNTFVDSLSVNHAHLSCEILWGDGENGGIIREFLPEDDLDEYIKTAIYWHSEYRYPKELEGKTKMFCDILRDADKVDIFRVNTETPWSEIHNLPEEEFYTSSVTKEVLDSFLEHHCVKRDIKKTAIDNIVGYTSLFWELVYAESRNMARQQGYLSKLAHAQSKNQETLKVFEIIRKELHIQ